MTDWFWTLWSRDDVPMWTLEHLLSSAIFLPWASGWNEILDLHRVVINFLQMAWMFSQTNWNRIRNCFCWLWLVNCGILSFLLMEENSRRQKVLQKRNSVFYYWGKRQLHALPFGSRKPLASLRLPLNGTRCDSLALTLTRATWGEERAEENKFCAVLVWAILFMQQWPREFWAV